MGIARGRIMIATAYKTQSGKTRYKPTVTSSEAHDGSLGFCLACGEEADGVEPDARLFECDACEASAVYGLEELALMGLLTITDDGDDDAKS
jgi:hypothetical protein